VLTYFNSSIQYVVVTLAILCLSACANLTDKTPIVGQLDNNPPIALGNIEYHTAILAEELFINLRADKQYRYAVAAFVPVKSLQYDPEEQGPLMLLGHQLEQGMMTEASRRGFITQDYKVTNDIIIRQDSETVFSRNVKQLSDTQPVDFFISGTITEQQEGAIVNARVIHVKSKDVVAAATKFIPADVFWQREKVSKRNGMIYRTSSK
jgi:TolB-like protein